MLPELLGHEDLRDLWVAVDLRGGQGLRALRSGGVVVDFDEELDALCRRVDESRRTSLAIVYCGERPQT